MSVMRRDHVQKARDALSRDQNGHLYRGAMAVAMEDLDAALAGQLAGAVETLEELKRLFEHRERHGWMNREDQAWRLVESALGTDSRTDQTGRQA